MEHVTVRFSPDPDLRSIVRRLAMIGTPIDVIVSTLVPSLEASGVPSDAVTEDFVRLHFAAELQNASHVARANIASAVYQKAMNGDTKSQIFWLKHIDPNVQDQFGETEADEYVAIMPDDADCDEWAKRYFQSKTFSGKIDE